MASFEEELQQDELDDAQTVAFIQQQLPQELKEKFTEEQLYYFLDVITEYYAESGILDAEPDKDGFIDIDVEAIAAYLAKTAKHEHIGNFSPEDLIFVVEAEMDSHSLDE